MSLFWQDIKGFEGCYQISNTGRVRSLTRKSGKRTYKGREMKILLHTNGYCVIWLRKPGVHKKFFVHRLVAYHFIEVIEGKDYVNHKDKNRENNHVDNLEFMTHKENCHHRDNYSPNDDYNSHIPF